MSDGVGYCQGYVGLCRNPAPANGNGGIGAAPKTFSLGLSQATIDKQYGGGKAGNPTGWLCGTYRGSFNPSTAKVKPANPS